MLIGLIRYSNKNTGYYNYINKNKKNDIPVIMKNSNGELVVSLKDIAAGIGKEHYDIIKKIHSVLNDGEFSVVEYMDAKGENKYVYFKGLQRLFNWFVVVFLFLINTAFINKLLWSSKWIK